MNDTALSGHLRAIRDNGLAPCCKLTLSHLTTDTTTGDRTECKWCGTKMWVANDGTWEFDLTDEPRTV